MTTPDPDLTLHAWPLRPVGGQHAGPVGYGVLVVHEPTGLAVACTSERSQLANRELAIQRLRDVLAVYEAAGSAIDRLHDHEAAADAIRAAWRVDTTSSRLRWRRPGLQIVVHDADLRESTSRSTPGLDVRVIRVMVRAWKRPSA